MVRLADFADEKETEEDEFADIIGCAIAKAIKEQNLKLLKLLLIYTEKAADEGEDYTNALRLAREILADS